MNDPDWEYCLDCEEDKPCDKHKEKPEFCICKDDFCTC